MSGDSGWNAVIHHPSDLELQNWDWDENDGEQDRELPSTVDMDAIKGGGNWGPATGHNGANSDYSEDESDSDDESSGGSEGSCSYSDSNSESDDDSSGDDSESNSDCTSEQSEQTFSIRETNFEQGGLKLKIAMKAPAKKEELEKPKNDKNKKVVAKRTKTPSRINKTSECSADDSDNSNSRSGESQPQSQAQQPLQEINQEDLAAILPDQNNGDAPFDGFEDSDSGRLVSKAIERMSLGADSDTSENPDQNPVPVYSSSLLQQFVEKTALLSEPQKKRNKLVKKLNESEYACASNVSPDSGIQSVNNSPLHLNASPASPPTSVQSPNQPAPPKPVVNVDRVLYPPKRKPGRPAKAVFTQPRGPGRPKLKPEIAAKIEKIEKAEMKKKEPEKKEAPRKSVSVQKKESKEVEEKTGKAGKNKKIVQKRLPEPVKSAKKIEEVPEKVSPRRKCLNKLVSGKRGKVAQKCDEKVYKRPERVTVKKDADKVHQKVAEVKGVVDKSVGNNKRVPKENRGETAVGCKKTMTKKPVAAVSRRVLKENKSNKKTSMSADVNGASVQSVAFSTSDSVKSDQSDNSNKMDKVFSGIRHNHHHHKHHHKHRRRIIDPPKTPVRVDPSIIHELEKLSEEFTRCCSLGKNGTTPTTGEVPQIFKVKKLTKKRKGSNETSADDQKLKRRPKKDKPSSVDSTSNTSTNSASTPNEQRLPLKKRHYHVSSPYSSQSSHGSGSETNQGNESKTKASHIEEAIEATINRYGSDSTKEKQSTTHKDNVPVTPKKRHRDTESSASEKTTENTEVSVEKPSNAIEQPRRKKKIVKDLRVTVTKLIPESSLLEKLEKSEKSIVNEKPVKSVEKKDKTTLEKTSKTDKSEPVVEKSAKKDSEVKKSEAEPKSSQEKLKIDFDDSKPLISALSVDGTVKKKARRRKAINRTGFPSVKKKKKKVVPVAPVKEAEEDGPTPVKVAKMSPKPSETKVPAKVEVQKKSSKEPKEGETKEMKNVSNSCGQLRVRKDLVEPVSKSEKLSPKSEDCSESKIFDENESLEESLARYNQSQKLAELNRENLKKLEKSSSKENNNNMKRSRKSSSPCPLKNSKRAKTDESESDAIPSSDVASEDIQEPVKVSGRGRRKQTKSKKSTAGESKLGEEKSGFEESELKGKSNDETKNKTDKKVEKKVESEKKTADHKKVEAEKRTEKKDGEKKSEGKVENEKKSSEKKSEEKKTEKKMEDHKKGSDSKKVEDVKSADKNVEDKVPDVQKDEKKVTEVSVKNHKAPCESSVTKLEGKNKNSVPSWNYKKIRCNVYFDVKPTTLYEPQACECKSETGCGDECINRMCFSECSPQLCPCGEKCKNQKIQKHDCSPGLQRFMTENKGWGVKTNQAIKTGAFILEYVGEVVSEREFKSRMATRYADDTHHYCLHLDGGLVIDGHRMGGDGRFVNHSCEPNCDMQKWSVNGLPRMALFASRDIKPGEELTYDYNFALFNPSEGQQCKCGSNACRGVIGGKSQRVSKAVPPTPARVDQGEKKIVGRPRKNARKSNTVVNTTIKGICTSRKITETKPTMIKPLSNQQRSFVQEHRCFLVRNLEKLRRMKVSSKEKNGIEPKTSSEVFLSQLTALSNSNSRTVRTRRLAQAQEDPEVNKAAKLAKVLKDLYTVVTTAKDENDQLLCSSFINLPAKRKLPQYYEKILDPIDLVTIEQSISNGHYKTAEQFDQDMIKLFDNNVRFFGRTSEIGIAAARLRKLYLGSKENFVFAITEATGLPPSQNFVPSQNSMAGEEDVIRCICGLHRDEGLMIQCERCLVWQHCDCVKADVDVESYLCERCLPRPVDLEIPIEGEDEEDKKYFVTLMRGDLQLRQGDTVYVLRDTPEKHTYKTIQKMDYDQMDIFRIERLWKNSKGEKFVYGHNYLRPHETYHEPTRKFYENEIVCAPLYEAVPLDLVAERCWVLDPSTFCKGRPVGSKPKHTYVCEYRVDRAARFFSKVARARHAVCTKPYAFETFAERIKHYRTYLPHSLEGIALTKAAKEKKKNGQEMESMSKYESKEFIKVSNRDKECWQKSSVGRGVKRQLNESTTTSTPVISPTQREDQRKRLNGILANLLDQMPNKKDPLDLSHLLERNRRNRKRPGGLNP